MSLQKGDPSVGQKLQHRLKKAKIVKTLAAFVGGGWLWLEFVHWILIDHYHLPETLLDIAFLTTL